MAAPRKSVRSAIMSSSLAGGFVTSVGRAPFAFQAPPISGPALLRANLAPARLSHRENGRGNGARAAWSTLPPVILPGTRLLDRYEVDDVLGTGGMGEVYRARDLRLQRVVALKVLPDQLAGDPAALARFEREAQALAALSHPHVVAVHDFGQAGGRAFAVMELLQGLSLRQRLKHGPLPWPRAVEIAVQIGDGLAAAHGRGIVHRDLKPENVFITPEGTVKVLDFGLARTVAATSSGDDTVTSALTEPGIVMGTVAYMAPEQLRGRPADTRTDIFALGCVVNEMITGRPPFQRETAADTLAAVLNAEPPDLAGVAPPVPAALRQAVRRALEKDPAARFQTVADMAFALRVTSSAEPATEVARPRSPRLPGRLVVPAVLVAVLAAAGGLWLSRKERPAVSSLAVLPFVSADGELEYLSDGLAEGLIQRLSRRPQLRVMARSTVFRYKGAAAEPRAVGSELKVDAVLTGRVAQRDDTLTVDAELVEVAEGARLWGERYAVPTAEMDTLAERMAREMARRLALPAIAAESSRRAEDVEAFRLYLKGRYHWNKRNAEGFRRAIALFQEAIERDPGYALAYVGLADTHALMAAYSVAPPGETMGRAKAAAVRALQIDDTVAEAHAALGLVTLLYDWDLAASERHFRRALDLNPGYATAHHWYAELLMAAGRPDEAMAELREAEGLDPLSVILVADQGRALFFARRYEEAVARCRRALETDPSFLPARIHLGMALEELGRVDEALREYEETARLSDGRQRVLVARALAAGGRPQEARRVLAEVVDLAARSYVSPYGIAQVHTALGDLDQAFSWLNRAVDERTSWIAFLDVNPRLDDLRSDPRFEAVRRRTRGREPQ